MAAEIRQEVELPQPVQRVWKALTDTEELRKWFATSTLRLEKGKPFRMYAAANPQWDGIWRCSVIDFAAPRRLVYSWQVGEDPPHRVEWTLTPTSVGTLLRVRHSGFAPDWALRAIVTRGIEGLLGNLRVYLRTGEPQLKPYTPTPEQLA
ncbi:MAG: SRPBCC family protein [Thermoplasmatota archaeon]